MFGGRQALVVTVPVGRDGPCHVDRTGLEALSRVVAEGVRIAREAGLDAEAITADASGPVWKTILEIAERHDAATIVMGSRGLTGVSSMLLGGVVTAVVNRASRPTLVIPRPFADE